MAILQSIVPSTDLTTMTNEQLVAMIQAMQTSGTGKLTLKISEKGALCVYGLGRWPVTLYSSQWRRLLTEVPAIEAFLKSNASRLTEKPPTA